MASVIWTTAMILSDDDIRDKVYEEVDQVVGKENGKPIDVAASLPQLEFVKSCFMEALRMKTYSVGYRLAVKDHHISFPKTGKKYKVSAGNLVAVPFTMNHMDSHIFESPEKFMPERFQAKESGKVFSKDFSPFSKGRHRCSGSPLVLAEIPIFLAYLFRRYNITLLDPFPPLDWLQSFGVVSPVDNAPIRISYTLRS